MTKQILALDIAGNPFKWLSLEQAIYRIANNKVAWTLGDEASFHFAGGFQKNGERSSLVVPPIIALARSEGMAKHLGDMRLGKDNTLLFKRDRHICAYCGKPHRRLTREHIKPRGQGGKDVWENVVTACKPCNEKKACRTPEQAGMPLLFLPYVPNRFEHFILSGRTVLADQMDYLAARLPRHSRLILDA